jgi:predicted permease
MLRELRYTLRRLNRTRQVSVVVVSTLVIALGGSTAIFAMVRAVVLRPLPVASPEHLIGVFPASGEALFGVRGSTLALLAQGQSVLDGLCGVSHGAAAVQVEQGGPLITRAMEAVSGECARVLRLTPSIGRLINPEDAPVTGAAAEVAVVSHRFWRETFGSTTDALGKTIAVQGVTLTIIGVLADEYTGLNRDESPDLMVPLAHSSGLRSRDPVAARLIGRLRSGTTLESTAVQLRTIWPTVWREANPKVPAGGPSRAGLAENLQVVTMERGFSSLRNRYTKPLYALTALATLLVLLACVSLSGMFLARTIDQEHQLRTQIALGANRTCLARQVLWESGLLALAAAILAIPVASWISQAIAIELWTSSRPLTMRVTPDGWSVTVLLLLTLACATIISLPSVVTLYRKHWQIAMSGSRSIFKTVSLSRGLIIIGQTAVAYVLLFAAGLFLVNLHGIRSIDPGFSTHSLRWTRLEPIFGAPRAYDFDGYVRSVVDNVSAIPGVQQTALSVSFPTTSVGQATITDPYVVDDGRAQLSTPLATLTDWISPGFFSTTGIPLRKGRDLSWQDTANQPSVAIISELMAATLFPDGNAVGQRVRALAQDQAITVVGVAADASQGDPRIRYIPKIYRPMMQEARVAGAPAVSLRLKDGGGLSLEQIRRAVQPLGRHDLSYVRTIEEQRERLLAQERVLAALSLVFAGLGVLISALGLYGALAQLVSHQKREIGLRLALGASRSRVLRSVISHGVALVVLGTVVGLPFSVAVSGALRHLLHDVSASRTELIGAVVLLIATVGLVSATMPAIRAIKAPLAEAMRAE